MTMRHLTACVVILFLIISFSHASDRQNELPLLRGPYLGQTPPGITPVIFAPGIVSRDGSQGKVCIAPDNSEIIFWEREWVHNTSRLLSVICTNGVWGAPVVLPFSQEYINNELALCPDGTRLFFVSNRPLESGNEAGQTPDIWISDKVDGHWGEPRNAGAPVNTPDIEVQPLCTDNNRLYFCRQTGDVRGVYFSDFKNGRFTEPMPVQLNTTAGGISGPCISPDQRKLFVHAKDERLSTGWDLYVAFADESGRWGELLRLGPSINTERSEADATVSPDGKYLFFSRDNDVYWVNMSIVDSLKSR